MGSDPLIGKLLHDTHKIVRRIGIGGMGTVYEAVHVRLRKQRFAVKVLHAGMVDNESLYARFRQEAEVSTEIGHPNIVYVTDFYETDQGQPCIVMEYLRGENLAQRLKKKAKLSAAEIIQIMEEVGSALQAVHDKDVVHRDLKPGNIFLCSAPGGSFRVKVLDFGISKIRDSGNAITGDMAVLGTPSYMSPEQGEGRAQDVDHRTDIFALGIICYRMLSNVLPFNGPTMVSVIRAICDKPHTPITVHLPELGGDVDRVLNRALAKDKEQRYSRIEDLVREFRAALEGPEPWDARAVQGTADEVEAAAAWATSEPEEEATTPIPVEVEQIITPISAAAPTVSRPGETGRQALGPQAPTVSVGPEDEPALGPEAMTATLVREEPPPAPAPEEEVSFIIQGASGDTTLSGATGEVPPRELAAAPVGDRGRMLVTASACASVLALAGIVYLLWSPAEYPLVDSTGAPVEEMTGGAVAVPVIGPDAAVQAPVIGPDAALQAPVIAPDAAPKAAKLSPDAGMNSVPDRSTPGTKKQPAPGTRMPAREARPVRKRRVVRKRPRPTREPASGRRPAEPPKRPAEPKKRPAFEDL